MALCWWAKIVLGGWRRQQPSRTLRARATSSSMEGLVIFIASTLNMCSTFVTVWSSKSFRECWNSTGTTNFFKKIYKSRKPNAALVCIHICYQEYFFFFGRIAPNYIRKNEELGFTLEFRYGLGAGEEVDGGVRLCHASEEFEDAAEAPHSEEWELRPGFSESGSECKCDFSVESLLVQRVDQFHHCRFRLSLRLRGWAGIPEGLFQVHLFLFKSCLCCAFN